MDLGSLTEKKGPLPVWAWALVSAGVLYLLYRHFSSGGSSSTASSSATPTAAVDGSVATPPTDIASGPVDTSGNAVTPVDTLPNTQAGDTTLTPWWADPTQWPTEAIPPLSSGDPIGASTVDGTPVLPKDSVPPKVTARTTKPPLKSIIPGITGKVISQKVLPSGAKLVTLQGGKKIEQAKGKKAYVVSKGKKK